MSTFDPADFDQPDPLFDVAEPSAGLPPALYWSAALAATDPEDPLAGLIDATVATVPMRWLGGEWLLLDELPADALRLVCEPASRTGADS